MVLPSTATLAALVRERTGVSWSRARALCEQGRVWVDGEPCLDPARRVASDAAIDIRRNAPKATAAGALAADAVVFYDRDVVVVDKPAGMLSVADEPGRKDSLDLHVRTLLRRLDRDGRDAKLGVVHRLDRETSGVMVFARTAQSQRALAAQFRAHDVDRVYEAIVHGRIDARRIESDLLLDRGDGLRGSHGHFRRSPSPPPAAARHAVTHVTPVARLEQATLVECRLETGRQHQIRIHLAEAGHPLLGERVYIRDYEGARIDAPRVMLHARTLGFIHPRTGKPVSFERPRPADFETMLEALR
jgi:23S rRNA pseudouridine1911/1915/1917 synthase